MNTQSNTMGDDLPSNCKQYPIQNKFGQQIMVLVGHPDEIRDVREFASNDDLISAYKSGKKYVQMYGCYFCDEIHVCYFSTDNWKNIPSDELNNPYCNKCKKEVGAWEISTDAKMMEVVN